MGQQGLQDNLARNQSQSTYIMSYSHYNQKKYIESMGYSQFMNLKTLPHRNGGDSSRKCTSWRQSETLVQLLNYSKICMQYNDDTMNSHLLFIFVILYKGSGFCNFVLGPGYRGKTYLQHT